MTTCGPVPSAGGPAVDRAEIQARIGALRDELACLGVRSLRLFGSAARDELGPDSDVDLLVEFEGPTRFRGFMAARDLLRQALGCDVDLVTQASLKPLLRQSIARELVDAP